jgi:hypothetical protein
VVREIGEQALNAIKRLAKSSILGPLNVKLVDETLKAAVLNVGCGMIIEAAEPKMLNVVLTWIVCVSLKTPGFKPIVHPAIVAH